MCSDKFMQEQEQVTKEELDYIRRRAVERSYQFGPAGNPEYGIKGGKENV